MKITAIKPILAGGRYLFLEVHTDEGLVGVGECGAWGYQLATAEALRQIEKLVVGMDPLRIEHIWNILTRNMHFRGSVIMAAISGVDIALWDLKGKFFGVPVYQLMGGKVRDRLRIYVNASGRDAAELAASAKSLKERGFNAIRFSIGHAKYEHGGEFETYSGVVARVAEAMAAMRAAVGWDMDIAIEVHRGLKPAEAIELGRAVAPYRPFFYEDPIPDNAEAMQRVIDECGVPVATGERFINPQEFDTLFSHSSVRFARPDMCVAGGLTAGKKIAAMAEVKDIYIIPHNPLGPISTAACLQLDACIPNFEAQEYPMRGSECRLDAEMKQPFVIENGFVLLPEGPGLGVELIDDIGEVFPFAGSRSRTPSLHHDGSMVDR